MSEPDGGPLVGLTGARFGGAQRQRKRRPAADRPVPGAAPDSPAAPPANPVVGLTGARFGRAARESPAPVPEPEPPAPVAVPEPVLPVAADPEPDPEPEPDQEPTTVDGVRVRPYVLTGGRTRASRELPIESLVSIGLPGGSAVTLEERQVMDLCARPRSIAEVAALVGVPLGVARVLVADLADTGAVTVHATVTADVALMRRVLAGLHRL